MSTNVHSVSNLQTEVNPQDETYRAYNKQSQHHKDYTDYKAAWSPEFHYQLELGYKLFLLSIELEVLREKLDLYEASYIGFAPHTLPDTELLSSNPDGWYEKHAVKVQREIEKLQSEQATKQANDKLYQNELAQLEQRYGVKIDNTKNEPIKLDAVMNEYKRDYGNVWNKYHEGIPSYNPPSEIIEWERNKEQQARELEAQQEKTKREAEIQFRKRQEIIAQQVAPDLVEKIKYLKWDRDEADYDDKWGLVAKLDAQIDRLEAELDHRVQRELERQERREAGQSVLGIVPLLKRRVTAKAPFEGVSVRLFPGTLAMLWANKGEGKSSVMVQTAIELALSGKRVLYIQTEETIDQTITAVNQWLELNPGNEDILNHNLIPVDGQVWENELDDITAGRVFDLATSDTIRDLTEIIEADTVDVVMIDTMSSAFQSEDSDMLNDRIAKRITKSLLDLTVETGATILFAHHSGRNGDHYFGSHTWGAKSQTVLALSYSKSTKRISVKEQHQRYAAEDRVTLYQRVGELLVSPVESKATINDAINEDRESMILSLMQKHGKPIGATAIAKEIGLSKTQVDRVLKSIEGSKTRNLGREGWEML